MRWTGCGRLYALCGARPGISRGRRRRHAAADTARGTVRIRSAGSVYAARVAAAVTDA
jgi:hypothetical protein